MFFWPKNEKNGSKNEKKLVFLAFYAQGVMWASKFFAWMILGQGCTIMQNGKLLCLQILEKFNFEFFQNFEISLFWYKMGFFSLDVSKKMPNLTHMIHHTHNCFTQNFILVLQVKVWKIGSKSEKFFWRFWVFWTKMAVTCL